MLPVSSLLAEWCVSPPVRAVWSFTLFPLSKFRNHSGVSPYTLPNYLDLAIGHHRMFIFNYIQSPHTHTAVVLQW